MRCCLPFGFLVVSLGVASCGSDSGAQGECQSDACPAGDGYVEPSGGVIEQVDSAGVLLPGSRLRVRGAGLDTYTSAARLVLVGEGRDLDWSGASGGDLYFTLGADTVQALGPTWSGEVYVVEGPRSTNAFQVTLSFGEEVPLVFEELEIGQKMHFNDPILLCGEGMPSASEGQSWLVLEGTFAPDSGAAYDVSGEFPLTLVEEFDRERAQFLFDTSMTGLVTGQFSGVAKVRRLLPTGIEHTTTPTALVFDVTEPEVYVWTPELARLGSIIEVTGAGFLAAGLTEAAGTGESTVFELEGVYTADADGTESKVSEVVVPTVHSGERATFVLSSELDGDRLMSSLFKQRSGSFEGTLRAVTSNGAGKTLTSEEAPVTLRVLTTGQVVYLSFLPGFEESLHRFGLSALEPEIRATVQYTIGKLYKDYALDVRLELPKDVDENHYATVEIGGPDPNGIGLLGFDNTPGKDVGNLRLFDKIGGANAQTQADGYPGYGGVFIEAFLYFSSHPELPGAKPASAPEAVAAFDEIFDGVRKKSATWSEYQGEGDFARVKAVRLAADTLARLVGETTAHEIGHSLGLANPYGPANSYHNAVDQPGCLMDSGSDRPFNERAGLPGAAPTIFCHDHPEYLMDILGPR